MDLYGKALFDAFVWTQAVENVVHDLVLECAEGGRLRIIEKERAGRDQLNLPLGQLIEKLKPCVTVDFYSKLKRLNRMRIEVVHHSNYLSTLGSVRLPEWVDNDIGRLQEVKNCAENIHADLLRIFDDFFPIGEPPVPGLLD